MEKYSFTPFWVCISLCSDGVPLSGESPARQDFPRQSHRVDARRDFSRWPHRPCWVRGRNSDLGLVIDIAQLLLSNVRMREMCWHGDLTQSRCAQQKPLNRDCPRQAGAFDDSLNGLVVKKIRPLQTVPGKRDPVWMGCVSSPFWNNLTSQMFALFEEVELGSTLHSLPLTEVGFTRSC